MVRAHSLSARLLGVLAAAFAAATPCSASGANYSIAAAGPPAGFGGLEEPRELLVDVYFGERKVGEAWITARPGFVRFRDPDQLYRFIPQMKPSPALNELFASDLQDNAKLACSQTNSGQCGVLNPALAGVILDEDRFRLNLFLHPDMLEANRQHDVYLAPPTAPFSLTSSVGAAIAGSNGHSPAYNLQNRTIIGLRNARIRSDSSMSSGLGLLFDDLVAEVDTNRHRYSAGLFWAPGVDFTGRRRIVGLGFGTQFDTRADAEILDATPLILFLNQPARVETLVDGRLVSSGSYEAGNNYVDSSSLPDGSYPLVLRIREAGGAVREERRFFVKNAQMPPQGQMIYYGYAGMLANTQRHQPISFSRQFYYQLGAAKRLNEAAAIDAAIIGADRKAMAQVGGWLATGIARIRAAGLISSEGDKGLLLQAGSQGNGRLNFNFDLRRVWSRKNEPLIPLASSVYSYNSEPPTGIQIASGSYSQATGSLSYGLGQAHLSVIGSYRRDRGLKADYSIGPSLSWTLANRGGLQVVMNLDAQRSRSATAAFAGFRVLFTSGSFSTVTTGGYANLTNRGASERSRSRRVGSVSGQWFYQDEERTQVGLEGALQRDVETSSARANAFVATQLGSLRADVLHGLEGNGATQYGVTVQTGIAIGSRAVELGGRDLNQSAVIASIAGSAKDATFDVLIDEVPRGRLGTSRRLPIFLEPYRSYRLRLRPVGSTSVNYDSSTRTVTLYPGNVEHLAWTAESLFTVFGQAVSPAGQPIANAMVMSRRGVGQTDDNGFFQIDVESNDALAFKLDGETKCDVTLAGLNVHGDYARLGKVVCR
jgi:Mat/Ecp fimbriae outer membrane usher protein